MSSLKLKKTKKERKKDETRARSVVADTRVAGQGLVVKDKSVWCTPCGKWVTFHGFKYVLHHCFGAQLASGALAFARADEETKLQLKHYRNLVQRRQEQAKRDALRIALDKQRDKMHQRDACAREESLVAEGVAAKKKAAWKGLNSQLPAETLAARVDTLRLLRRLGIPPLGLEDPEFQRRLQGDGPDLGGRHGVTDVSEALFLLQLAELEAELQHSD
jgi:hypothetical protein